MDTIKLYPEIRFKGEDGKDYPAWQEKKLGELGEFTASSVDKLSIQGEEDVSLVNYLNVYRHEKLDTQTIPKLMKVTARENQITDYSLRKGDILFTPSSETPLDIGVSEVVLEDMPNTLYSYHLVRFRPIVPLDLNFTKFFCNTDRAKKQFYEEAQGASRFTISPTAFSNVRIMVPSSLKEQRKIGQFLSTVDEKIDLLTKKKELLEKYKAGVMQKLFSRELRFTDEDGNDYPEWEKMKIDSIYKVSRGEVLSMKKVSPQKGNEFIYPVYSSQTKNGGLCGFYNSYLYEDCITWTTDGAGAGDVNFRKGKFYATNVCGVLSNKEGYANQCIAEILNGVTRRYVSYVGNPKLMGNVMGEISIVVPSSLSEQQKIAEFLSAIDEKLHLVSKQIEQTTRFKKALLQKMFV